MKEEFQSRTKNVVIDKKKLPKKGGDSAS